MLDERLPSEIVISLIMTFFLSNKMALKYSAVMFASGADSVDRYLGSSRYVDPWKGDGLQDGYRAQEWLPIGSTLHISAMPRLMSPSTHQCAVEDPQRLQWSCCLYVPSVTEWPPGGHLKWFYVGYHFPARTEWLWQGVSPAYLSSVTSPPFHVWGA